MGPRRRGRKQALHHEPRGVISLRSNRYGLLIAGLTHVVPWVMSTAAVVFFIVWGVSFTEPVRDTAALTMALMFTAATVFAFATRVALKSLQDRDPTDTDREP